MQHHVKKWLRSLIWNFIGLLVALATIYVAGIVAILQVSARSSVQNPYFKVDGYDFLIILAGIMAVWFVFRCIGRLYELAMHPPRSE